tara:strand:+ start:363 stop:557 length:195 start_codon:yes stop_codon:yes gene_type:complete
MTLMRFVTEVICYRILNNSEGAYFYLNKVLKIDPTHNEACHAIGFLDFAHAKFDKAHKGMRYRY